MNAALHLADTEPETRGFLERHLPHDGFRLVGAGAPFDLVLAADVAGVDRWVERAPVIVLGREEADSVDRIHAFRRGCDDYVPQPFEYQELVERIRAVLRRVQPRDSEVVEAGPISIDTRTRVARIDGVRLQLAQKEYALLLHLAREPERVFTKAELLKDVWGFAVPGRTRTLDSHASRVRRKLREATPAWELVENVWGVGYRLIAAPLSRLDVELRASGDGSDQAGRSGRGVGHSGVYVQARPGRDAQRLGHQPGVRVFHIGPRNS